MTVQAEQNGAAALMLQYMQVPAAPWFHQKADSHGHQAGIAKPRQAVFRVGLPHPVTVS